MKTAISLPDDVFQTAERMAKRLKVSRSELYSRALREFLARHTPDELTESWDAVVADVGQDHDTAGAARAIFERVEW
jgi:metal-responsive CopG/Arc/MetJ family transcriptional regulator